MSESFCTDKIVVLLALGHAENRVVEGRGRGGHNYGAMQSNDRNIRTRKELEKMHHLDFGWKIEQTR